MMMPVQPTLQKKGRRELISRLAWITFFGIAMGYLESAVVVYLREIYYGGGFDFPLVAMDTDLAITEIIREASTIIMLLAIGRISGRYFSENFAWFLYSFAIWDIFYYVFLKLLVGWPESLLTWDILFLIPVTWTGPVIAPVIVSLTMIFLALTIVILSYGRDVKIRIGIMEWIAWILGSLVVITAFVWDYASFLVRQYRAGNLDRDTDVFNELFYQYVPLHFNWLLFATGEVVIIAGIFLLIRNIKHNYPSIPFNQT